MKVSVRAYRALIVVGIVCYTAMELLFHDGPHGGANIGAGFVALVFICTGLVGVVLLVTDSRERRKRRRAEQQLGATVTADRPRRRH